jgi:hypothetical protein
MENWAPLFQIRCSVSSGKVVSNFKAEQDGKLGTYFQIRCSVSSGKVVSNFTAEQDGKLGTSFPDPLSV